MIKLKVMVGETRDSLRLLPSAIGHSYGVGGYLEIEGFVRKSLIYGDGAVRDGVMLSGIQLGSELVDAGISQPEIDAVTSHIKGMGFQDVEIKAPLNGFVMYVAKGSFQNCEIVGDSLAFFNGDSAP
jgi:hypothetical protein